MKYVVEHYEAGRRVFDVFEASNGAEATKKLRGKGDRATLYRMVEMQPVRSVLQRNIFEDCTFRDAT